MGLINTSRGKMTVEGATSLMRTHLETPATTREPRDSALLLGILRQLPEELPGKTIAAVILRDLEIQPELYRHTVGAKLIKEARRRLYEPVEDFVSFGDFARTELHQQCQYASRYVYGTTPGYPKLGENLRYRDYEEGVHNYHALRIHIDDLDAFRKRYLEHRGDRI